MTANKRYRVNNLRLAWTYSTGFTRGHEAAPLVVGDTMYFVTPFPNVLYAFDLRNNGAKKWEYAPKPVAALSRRSVLWSGTRALRDPGRLSWPRPMPGST